MTFHAPNQYRLRTGPLASPDEYGTAGFFIIPGPYSRELRCMISDGQGWEHVSVSIDQMGKRTPSWDEMCFVKATFWDDEDEVMQFHPKRSEYVNHHPGCLHLWRPTEQVIVLPPSIFVGPKS